jgi:hypothetical protein
MIPHSHSESDALSHSESDALNHILFKLALTAQYFSPESCMTMPRTDKAVTIRLEYTRRTTGPAGPRLCGASVRVLSLLLHDIIKYSEILRNNTSDILHFSYSSSTVAPNQLECEGAPPGAPECL